MIIESYKTLYQQLICRFSPPQVDWVNKALQELSDHDDPQNKLLELSAVARRKLRDAELSNEQLVIKVNETLMPFNHWSYAEAGRNLLILKVATLSDVNVEGLVKQYISQADEWEITAIIRLLFALESGEPLKYFALDVGRTNNKQLFSALLEYNPFPQAFYTDHEFNQLVLKALFLELPISTISGLKQRANQELSQMCEDYIRERLAADRSIPVEVWLALAPYTSDYGEELMFKYLSNGDSEHRYNVIAALLQQSPLSNKRKQRILAQQLHEKNEAILAFISRMDNN